MTQVDRQTNVTLLKDLSRPQALNDVCPVPGSSIVDHVVLTESQPSDPTSKHPSLPATEAANPLQRGQCVTLPTSETHRWLVIEEALSHVKTAKTCDDLLNAIRRYRPNMPELLTLKEYVTGLDSAGSKKLFEEILPKTVDLALSLPTVFTQPLPRLTAGKELSVTMSQKQAACLLACGFFCLFSGHDYSGKPGPNSNRKSINFDLVFRSASKPKRQKAKVQKLACFLHYFDRVTTEMPANIITYHRRVIDEFPVWSMQQVKLERLHVTSEGLIEDQGFGMSQMDFANRIVGGGVLSDGCVQEEIRFTICPELIVSRLLADKMEDNECVVIIGCERFCDYDGYGDGFRFKSNHVDKTPRDKFGRLMTEVVAIDATPYRSPGFQFEERSIRRELGKAYCGFHVRGTPSDGERWHAVATGNWGCGAYRGDHRLKAVIQLMAAAVNKRDVAYFTFNDDKLCSEIIEFHRFACEKSISVQRLWQLTVEYGQSLLAKKKKGSIVDVFSYIYKQLDG